MAKLTAVIIARAVFGRNLSRRESAEQVITGFTAYQRASDSFNLGYFLGWDEGWRAGGRSKAPGHRHGPRGHRWRDQRASSGEGDAGSMVDC